MRIRRFGTLRPTDNKSAGTNAAPKRLVRLGGKRPIAISRRPPRLTGVQWMSQPGLPWSAVVSGLEAPQPAAGLASAPAKDAAGTAYQLTLVLIGAYAVAAVLLMRFAARPGPTAPGISAFFAAGVFVTEFATAFLLFARFRESRRWSILLLACA